MAHPKNPINGWLVIDKPLEMSSAQAVGAVKRILRPKKIGHGGTLDPLASGILPLGLGEATKAFQFVVADKKTYRFTVKWGEERSTDDAEGKVIQSSDARPTKEQIEAELPAFIGTVLQAPPAFSAIKIDGKRAYAKARAGETVEIPPREVEIFDLKIIEMPDDDHTSFEMTCGKGTYVRSVARDLGRKMGCFGHVSMLRRTKVGKFDEKGAISLEKLEDLVHSAAPNDAWLLPIAYVLDDIPAVEVNQNVTQRLMQGQTVALSDEDAQRFEQETTVRAMHQGSLIAIAKANEGKLKPERVFLT